jgi:hypothetical protein
MLVTCKICGKKIDRDSAYKIITIGPKNGKKTNHYYCSEEEWQKEEERKKKAQEDKNRVYSLICDMFGYKIQSTKFFDEWAKWNKLKSNEIIYKYLRENESHLQQICDKLYDNEYSRIMYFSAILKNSLRDFKPKVKTVEQKKAVIDETIYNTPAQSLNKRRSLADLEDMF